MSHAWSNPSNLIRALFRTAVERVQADTKKEEVSCGLQSIHGGIDRKYFIIAVSYFFLNDV